MSDDVDAPELLDVLELVKREVLDRIKATEICRVTRFAPATSSVSIQPLVSRAFDDLRGARVSRARQEIHEVPVWFFGASSCRITVPVSVGDYGLALFCSSSTSRWKRRGGVVDPGDDRKHWDDDVFFLPGGSALVNLPTPVPTDALVIHSGGKRVKIGGPTGTQKTLMADSFLSALDTLVDGIHTAVGAIPGGSTAAAALLGVINTFKSSLVRDGYKTVDTEVR